MKRNNASLCVLPNLSEISIRPTISNRILEPLSDDHNSLTISVNVAFPARKRKTWRVTTPVQQNQIKKQLAARRRETHAKNTLRIPKNDSLFFFSSNISLIWLGGTAEQTQDSIPCNINVFHFRVDDSTRVVGVLLLEETIASTEQREWLGAAV